MENQSLNITELSVEQLESLAYRLVKQLNGVQQNLNIVESEIQKRASEPVKEPVSKAEAKK